MAFENIDVSSLKSALNSCKNNLNYSGSKSIISSISNSNVWQCNSQKNLKNALDTLTDRRYKELENKIDKYLQAVTLIDRYKKLERNNKNLDSEYTQLESRLYYTETYTTTSTDSEGHTTTETHTRTVKDYNVESQMNNNRRTYNENKSTMNTLKNNVSNLI